ncbi:hypothetical protein QQF64_029692 [Cirrhinus molitorella]|uniref:Uncharacterized protein n=1 Tax=Cirrhinus molitorella TaxID=172907 RepID=A0ABR3N1I3_9TELE
MEVGFIKKNTENLNCNAVLTWRSLLTGKYKKYFLSLTMQSRPGRWFYQGKHLKDIFFHSQCGPDREVGFIKGNTENGSR